MSVREAHITGNIVLNELRKEHPFEIAITHIELVLMSALTAVRNILIARVTEICINMRH